jgi:hypothetical protein
MTKIVINELQYEIHDKTIYCTQLIFSIAIMNTLIIEKKKKKIETNGHILFFLTMEIIEYQRCLNLYRIIFVLLGDSNI